MDIRHRRPNDAAQSATLYVVGVAPKDFGGIYPGEPNRGLTSMEDLINAKDSPLNLIDDQNDIALNQAVLPFTGPLKEIRNGFGGYTPR